MKALVVCCIAILFLAAQGSATLAMYEAGKAVICIEDDFEKNDLLTFLDTYPTIYFEPITSREEVKNNEYNLTFTDISILSNDMSAVAKPTKIMISDKPFDLTSVFAFESEPVKNISIGRLGVVNTTLYKGSWLEQTPHVVAFTVGNFSCCIYNQDIRQDEMEDLLGRIDIVRKEDLAAYLPRLWAE